MKRKLRIIVTGLVGVYPIGGVAWDYLQYVIGLSKLGYDVYYHEDTNIWPYHPVEKQNTSDATYSVQFIDKFFKKYSVDLSKKWHYCHLGEKSFGMSKIKFEDIAKTADLYINVSGNNIIPEKLNEKCIKIFLDTDPGYNQIRLDRYQDWLKKIKVHDVYFSYAENINEADCLVPDLNIKWITTRMPVVTDLWKRKDYLSRKDNSWTTILTWNDFHNKLIFNGKEYKSKGAEFEKIKSIPGTTNQKFKIAVGGKNVPLKELMDLGWQVQDGPETTLTPGTYQNFILNSKGEFSIAKNVYVAMNTGWFSCRSVCYMAAGKPVVLQDTGFSKFIPTGKGVLAFSNLKEATEAIKMVEDDYNTHCKAASQIAEEYFGYEVVLKDMLKKIGMI